MVNLLVVFFAAALSAAAPQADKIIYGVSARVGSLDPYLISGIDTYSVLGFILEPLAKIEPATGELKPWLAQKWTVDKKANVVKIELRPEVKFHNDKPFSCADVEFTFNSYLEPKNKGEVWRAMWADVKAVKALTPLKCEIQFSRLTYQGFRNIMTALRILPSSFYEAASAKDRMNQAVGTGPFRVTRFDANRRLELEPFSRWWNARNEPQSKRFNIMVRPVSDPLMAKQLIAKGELDIYEMPSGQPPAGAHVLTVPSAFGRGFSLTVNMRNSVLKNKALRVALSKIWNREDLNQKLFAGKMKLALDSFSPNRPYYPAADPIYYDVVKARALLKKAGYRDSNDDGFLDDLNFKVLAKSHESERWLGLYQADAAKAGVKIQIERIDDEAQWWKLINEGKFDLLANDGALSEAPHQPVYHSKGAYNTSGLKDKTVDQLFDGLDMEFSAAKRKDIYRKLIQRLRDLAVEIPGLISMDKEFLTSRQMRIDALNPDDPWRWSKERVQSSQESR